MSQPMLLHHWTNQIKSMFPNPPKPQAAVLAAFSFGIAKAKSRAPNAIARDLAFLGIPDTVETRLRRFISNPRVDMAESCKSLARSVIRALPRKKPVILLVDETSLHDRLKAMVVSVAYEWRAIRGGNDDVSSDSVADGPGRDDNEDASGFGTELAEAETWSRWRTGASGTSPNLLMAIEGLGMRCMMRVSKIVRVMMDDETVFPFKSLTVEPGRSWKKMAKAVKNAGWTGRLGGAPSTVTATMSRGIWRRITRI